MIRSVRWGSGLVGVALAAVGLWAVLSPASVRRLVARLSPSRLKASFFEMADMPESTKVCTDRLEGLPGAKDGSTPDLGAVPDIAVARRSSGAQSRAQRHVWSEEGSATAREPVSGTPKGPLVAIRPDANLQEYLQAEVTYLTLLRQLGRELRGTVTRLWAARARRRRALAAWEVAVRRIKAQKARVDRRRKEIASFYQALYKLVDGWDQIPLLDRRHRAPPLDGRMELLAVIGHLKQELDAESKILASLDSDRKQALDAMERAKSSEASLDALRDTLGAKIARAQQELSDLRRLKEHRNRSREVWDGKARRLHKAVVELEEDLRREAEGFDALKGKLLRPVPGIVLPYPGSRRHKAVLLGAEPGWWARAPARGRVVFAGPVPGFGKVVILDHGEGFTSVVGYLSRLSVKKGERVRVGRPLGRVSGPKGLATRKRRYCYYELRRSGVPLDPFDWLRFTGRRSRAPRLRHGPRLPSSLPRAVADRLIPTNSK